VEPIARRALRGDCRLPRGSRVLLAVSGGADSTALLLALHRLAPEHGLTVAAAHLHHGLRGADADRDLEFVRSLCARLGVPLQAARWDTRARMRRLGLSGQDGLRTLRRRYLAGAARRAGATAIATAHTADDQAETLLLRMLRGTGLPGLGGMRPRQGRWIKPLLLASRAVIVRDLERIRQAWREDASNQDPGYARSRIRFQAIPALLAAMKPDHPEQARPALLRHLARAAEECRAAAAALVEAAPSLPVGERTLDRTGLREAAPALRRAALRLWWSRGSGARVGLTLSHLQGLEHLVTNQNPGLTIQLPCGWAARRDRDMLRLIPPMGPGEG
jgi:tRNA(Ile)-lysidine synthase